MNKGETVTIEKIINILLNKEIFYFVFIIFLVMGLFISIYKMLTYTSVDNEILDRINESTLLITSIVFYISFMFLYLLIINKYLKKKIKNKE